MARCKIQRGGGQTAAKDQERNSISILLLVPPLKYVQTQFRLLRIASGCGKSTEEKIFSLGVGWRVSYI